MVLGFRAANENEFDVESILTIDDLIDSEEDQIGPIMHLTMIDVMDYVREPFYVPENGLFNFRELKNRYYVIRHGESTANVRQLVVSDPKYGTLGFGLTEKGEGQIEERAKRFLREQKLRMIQLANVIGEGEASKKLSMDVMTDENTIVLSSDFTRALQTAKIFAKVAGLKSPKIAKALRERHFGNYDMTEGHIYPQVWTLDGVNYAQNENGVESVAQVLRRATGLIKIVEKMREGMNVFLVAHGDIGQILETGFRKMNPSKHRDLKHLENAEIREMWLNPLM